MIALDASTLILLAKTTILDLFSGNFSGNIYISETVRKEALAKKSFDAQLIEKRIMEGRLKVKKIKNNRQVNQLIQDFNIDEGEAETIGICLENNWQLLGTDDKNAIKACMVLEILYTTAMDILVVLNNKRHLPKEEAMLKLEKLSEFGRYADDIIENAKNMLR